MGADSESISGGKMPAFHQQFLLTVTVDLGRIKRGLGKVFCGSRYRQLLSQRFRVPTVCQVKGFKRKCPLRSRTMTFREVRGFQGGEARYIPRRSNLGC